MTELLDAALSYARRGWAVLPVHTPTKDGGCSCGKSTCDSQGKHPRITEWQKQATTDEATIHKWWKQWPNANIGINPRSSNLIVIDIDPRNGGDETWHKLKQQHGLNDNTVISLTGGGGIHLLYSADGIDPTGLKVSLGPGVDVQRGDKLIVAPPSLHKSKHRYEWEVLGHPDDMEPLRLHPSLLNLLLKPKGQKQTTKPVGREIPEGDRDNELARLAGGMRRNGMTESELLVALSEVNKRCIPPLPDSDVRRIAHSIARYDPAESAASADSNCPVLPECAHLTLAQEAESQEVGHWLDEYVQFASEASPMTPVSFHMAAGVYAGALAIARRLHLCVSTRMNTIYPNLYLLFVGHSTRPRKTTALRVLRGVLREADMRRFLLADRQTPEALSLDLTTGIPRTLDEWTPEIQSEWLEERGIAGQRGWLLEEASHLLDSFNRDYSKGLLPLVLDLYDSSDIGPTGNTISRGREGIMKPYLTVFGCTTYGALAEHAEKTVHWHNGLWARFALIGSDDTGIWKFWPPSMNYPPALIKRLRFLAYDLLPMPQATIETSEVTDNDGDSRTLREVIVDPPLVSSEVVIRRAAWEQWEQYSKAVGFDMLPEKSGEVSTRLYASYGRFGTTLIKVAMILAALDADRLPVTVEAAHTYRAQAIVEGWRANLHTVLSKMTTVSADGVAEHIVAVLAQKGREWTMRRDLLHAISKRWSDTESIIDDLEAGGEIERKEKKGKRGPSTEEYRLWVEESK